ncbi:glycosyltransferase [Lacibacter sp. H375]|uniref:glycosyltransferase n=1 Tax=Lacibacter sp. H375 TaxID=3133424 RepID=UPI0030BCDCA2
MNNLIHTPSPTSVDQLTSLGNDLQIMSGTKQLPEILFITSYPPRECGIATYSQDLVKALENKFEDSFKFSICALESNTETPVYTEPIKYVLNTEDAEAFLRLGESIEADKAVKMILIQHEFGFFQQHEAAFLRFLQSLSKPFAIVFHTVLPLPGKELLQQVQQIAALAASVIVMTKSSKKILLGDYHLPLKKITVIPHGTHLVLHEHKATLKQKYNLTGRTILSTFGLLSSGKNIETTLRALPSIVQQHPAVLFLIIGKTHPSIAKKEGESYREMLQSMVQELKLNDHVKFINSFLPLPLLLEYLQLTDIYLFTSKDRNQAVSGTFSYAISCGCPVISTPIPHAREVLKHDAGIIIDFEQPDQLAKEVNSLLNNETLRNAIGSNGLHRMAFTAWENAAIAHATLFKKLVDDHVPLRYVVPPVHLGHLKKMTTEFGIIQFSKINHPDLESGYTVDDNARALISMCQHFDLTRDKADINYINIYLRFIGYCQQADGSFLNYVNTEKKFTAQNYETNLDDANGRSIWALGYLISLRPLLPVQLTSMANHIFQKAMPYLRTLHSSRAMGFIVKGLYYRQLKIKLTENILLITEMGNRLLQMYRHEQEEEWCWYESYLTYANSVLPEAMLCAWIATGDDIYKETAVTSFDFLLSKLFGKEKIRVISNQTWMHKGKEILLQKNGGEQPIDVAYTILALTKFYEVFKKQAYRDKIDIAFNWFLGANHLQQVIYNPCTGGCYDGVEEHSVNLNQGAESTVSYLMARLTIEKLHRNKLRTQLQKKHLTHYNL